MSSDAGMLDLVGQMLVRRHEGAAADGQFISGPEGAAYDTVVGISLSGVPMATIIARDRKSVV